jgi:hypothetical protein
MPKARVLAVSRPDGREATPCGCDVVQATFGERTVWSSLRVEVKVELVRLGGS